MAYITGKKTIFFVTSPRTPDKLVDEIKFLIENFSDRVWNVETQKEFYLSLSKQPFFEGSPGGDVAFKARDRINRAPKSLGLVDLKPTIQITEAGKQFIYGKRPEEIFLRQLLKFQLPSPYHTDDDNSFKLKPYLELMRLISEFGSLSKTEIALFVVQLTDFTNYSIIKKKIEDFREEVKTLRNRKISYKKFVSDTFTKEISALFKEEISQGLISTRESKNVSLSKFISTKRSNHIDYADASIRYLRATGIFSLDPRTYKIYPIPDKIKDLEYVLATVDRNINNYSNEEAYGAYLFDSSIPVLLTDNKAKLIEKLVSRNSSFNINELEQKNIEELKDIYYKLVNENLNKLLNSEKANLREYKEYDDIFNTFAEIESKEIADPPLFLEWNVWRAFAMLNDGDINGNFKVDDDGIPLYTAPGNLPDISCKYNEFETIVEVTMSSGHKQYEMEGEPVARHYGNHKNKTEKDVFGIFIAPKINESTIAHYYTLYRMNVDYYGGAAKIIPISLDDFKKMLENAYKSKVKPTSLEIRKLWTELSDLALKTNSETEWYEALSAQARAAFLNV